MRNYNLQSGEMTPYHIENIVKNDNGRTFTTSLIVAEMFEKEHKNVLRDIENLECSPNFNQLNFEPAENAERKIELCNYFNMLFKNWEKI